MGTLARAGDVKRLAVIVALLPLSLHAQATARPGPEAEFKADVITEHDGVIATAGAGLKVPAGSYVRIDIAPGVGVFSGTGHANAVASLDAVARFLLDPFRQQSWGLSLGAGIGVRAQQQSSGRAFLIAVADLEGRRDTHGFSPAVQVGVGGGIRVGLALRRSDARRMER